MQKKKRKTNGGRGAKTQRYTGVALTRGLCGGQKKHKKRKDGGEKKGAHKGGKKRMEKKTDGRKNKGKKRRRRKQRKGVSR